MLYAVHAEWRDRSKLLFPVLTRKTVMKSDTDFPLGKRGVPALLEWACREFPGATVSFRRVDIVKQEQVS